MTLQSALYVGRVRHHRFRPRPHALSYRVFRAWVSEYQALPELDANANAVAIQSIKLENEGWERDYDVIEPGETPEQTAIRELFEETGLLGREPRLFETVELFPEDGMPESHFLLSVFRVEAEPETVAIADDDALEAGWFLPEEIGRLPVPDSVRACIERLVRAGEAG